MRYGVMHRNTFIHSPGKLNENYQMISRPELFFAGQMTGVEGYVESASSGLVAGVSMAKYLRGEPLPRFTRFTAIGAMGNYIANYAGADFQPMNISFGLIPPLEERIKGKQERYTVIAGRALGKLQDIIDSGALN